MLERTEVLDGLVSFMSVLYFLLLGIFNVREK